MNYELAKELRDSGFPQLHEQGEYLEDPNAPEGDTDGAYVPTLSELIHECKEGFDNLSYHPDNDDEQVWTTNGSSESSPDTYGSTPEEAVAKLWLKLNKKV